MDATLFWFLCLCALITVASWVGIWRGFLFIMRKAGGAWRGKKRP